MSHILPGSSRSFQFDTRLDSLGPRVLGFPDKQEHQQTDGRSAAFLAQSWTANVAQVMEWGSTESSQPESSNDSWGLSDDEAPDPIAVAAPPVHPELPRRRGRPPKAVHSDIPEPEQQVLTVHKPSWWEVCRQIGTRFMREVSSILALPPKPRGRDRRWAVMSDKVNFTRSFVLDFRATDGIGCSIQLPG